ncbi:O-linked N-acetylglucosamine transferase, SPINDLY family protein [Calothrix sp. NIES-2098]|uniref:O-linked N-acetylglucosamine transferase, SPINDLY family protein n=1 Tax=Calothrix sp. NIES-2098 TaxID=1954171 RepID=UPI000B60AFFB|nr:group 1 glycosyl transferase [Calothrix sp. NIES-2098]
MLINELRDINCIIFPDWSNLETAIAEDLIDVLRTLCAHPNRQDITLLIDSQSLSTELQDSANSLLFEIALKLSLEEAVFEDLNVGLTGQLTTQEWSVIKSLINFRIPIKNEDRYIIQQPEIAQIPLCNLSEICQHTVYEAARLESWRRWGDYFADSESPDNAIPYYTYYLSSCPHQIDYYLKLSNVLSKTGQIQAAIEILQNGITNCPQAEEIYFWMIISLKQSHKYLEARNFAQQATEKFPENYVFKMLSHLMLPEIYHTPEEIDTYRKEFQDRLEKLTQELTLNSLDEQKKALIGISHHTNFFLAYQGKNDVFLQQQYGQLVHKTMAANYPHWVQERPISAISNNRRIKVGYLSYFLCGWSGTVLFLNWLKYADNQKFEIYSYHIGHQIDAATQLFQSYSAKFYHLPNSLEQVCQQVIDDQLDVLIFPEIGMDATTLCIAGLRLAPIQCMAWGQPVTSGLPTIDYFLSSELMEPMNGQEHYTENLVRLPGVGISYPTIKVDAVRRQRSFFGLREDAIVYISSQAAYKYLPQHDRIYAEIARQVPNAQFMFLRQGIPQERLKRAFASVGLDSQDYCVFSPVLPREDYFDLLSLTDIYLDTLDWAGGNTTLDAIACHLPIVTCPGELMRGRHSYGFLQAIGVTDTIADDTQQYIQIAVRLAVDSDWRYSVRQALKRSINVLFDNPTATQNLETFLQQAIALRK